MPVYQTKSQVDQTNRPSRAERRRVQREAARISAENFHDETRSGLDALGMETTLERLEEMMEEDADEICGAPKGKHCPSRKANRHGTAEGFVVIFGRKVSVERPRVRTLDGAYEITLGSYAWAQDLESLTRTAVRATLLGVAQRRNRCVLDAVVQTTGATPGRGVSKSAISRRFVGGTQRRVEALLTRRLEKTRYLALYVDGIEEGGHHILVAMGLTEQGEKEILGLWEGSSENSTVCVELLQDLKRRGLSTERGLLVVIDGGKALSAAVKQVFGDEAAIQRCQVHKRRNILEKLPEKDRAWVKRAMEKAWRSESAGKAQAELEALADRLESEGRAEAANSLREGLYHTLTCLRLGVDAELAPSLTNTNPLESAFSVHEARAGRVKRWRNGNQVLRWVGVALLEAEESFEPTGTSESLERLGDALERYVADRRAAKETARAAAA